jgi:UDP-N-acetylglucosamine 4,6-dehydratase/5-epimerase
MNGKSVLITGGTGSFGKKFVTYLLKKYKKIKKLIIYSRDELKQSEMAMSLSDKKHECLRYFIGDVRDYARLSRAMKNVDIIIHAAALKQVPMAEYNPIEFIKTNVMGAQNIIEASLDNNVERVIALSTDKAAAPINLYGATKLCSDKLFVAANNYSGQSCKFSIVRYGNVFGSRGSVIPLFKKLSNSGYFPITSKAMTRFNISLEDGVNMVDWVCQKAIGGEIFVPKIPSYRITDLAKAMNPKNKLKIVGVRRGEKIHEEMITIGDSQTTYELDQYYVILPDNSSEMYKKFKKHFSILRKVEENFSYNSKTNKYFLKISEIKKMINKFETNN